MIEFRLNGDLFTCDYSSGTYTRVSGEESIDDFHLESLSVGTHELTSDALERRFGDAIEILKADPEQVEDVR